MGGGGCGVPAQSLDIGLYLIDLLKQLLAQFGITGCNSLLALVLQIL